MNAMVTKILLVLLTSFLSLSAVACGYPTDWKQMEVEAKWNATVNAFERIISDLPDGSSIFGYQLNVRWRGIPRKYVDNYYDTDDATLSKNSHALRQRTRYSSNPIAPNRKFSSLLNAVWEKDWERIQYKSTPVRIGAVWFRKEVGDCKIWDKANKGICPGLTISDAKTIIQDPNIDHDAITFMLTDHPAIDRAKLNPFLVVTDFRYRIEFKKDDIVILEASLDHLITENLLTGRITRDYEVELEIIAKPPVEDDLTELFRVARLIQERYALTPSTKSKGGNEVTEYKAQQTKTPLQEIKAVFSACNFNR